MVRYIVLEGIDGSGKSETAKRISAMIEGSVLTKEPTDRLAEVIMANDSSMGDALLFAADRAMAMEDVRRWLDDGKTVVSDRSVYSNMAYQGAALKDQFGGLEKTFQWVFECNRPFLIEPDEVILLDLPVETALGRVNKRGEANRFEMKEYLEVVREAYLLLAKRYGFKMVDATMSLEDVVEACAKILEIE